MNRYAKTLPLLLMLAATACTPGTTSRPSTTSRPGGASLAAHATSCEPEILFLPPLEGDHDSSLRAMNDRGWVVGYSHFDEPERNVTFSTAVMWRDGVAIDLGIGGGVVPGDGRVDSWAMDVNDDGVVAAQRVHTDRSGYRTVASSSWLWREGDKVRLRGTERRGRASVTALNDSGVAVGDIRGNRPDGRRRPVAWSQEGLVRLPLPPEVVEGWAVQINNGGLVIGTVLYRGSRQWRPWFWQLRGGSSGPLPLPPGEDVQPIDVDNRGRILGHTYLDGRVRGVLWPERSRRPQVLAKLFFGTVVDMNDHGDVTGSFGVFRGQGDRPWMSNLRDSRVVRLPLPPPEGWVNVWGRSVIRGITPLAPQGGISVGGDANSGGMEDSPRSRATIWTCAQTY
jgi:hypothetical protein